MDDFLAVLFLVVVFGVSVVLPFYSFYKFRRGRLIYEEGVSFLLEKRLPLSRDEFYAQYFETDRVPKDVVVGVMDVVEGTFGFSCDGILPDDQFDAELAFVYQEHDLADVEIIDCLEREFSIQITDQEAADIKTVRDMILCVWNKVQAHKEQEIAV